MGLELYYKIRKKAVGKNYAQISSKTSADHEQLNYCKKTSPIMHDSILSFTVKNAVLWLIPFQ